MQDATEKKTGTLYIVGTPIGNLGEITYRAVETLKAADYILCEDCRHSLKLLTALDIKKPLVSHHKFNERERVDSVIKDLSEGKNIALITDAGMPCISDPGAILVAACIQKGLPHTVVGGPSAGINALILSGLDTERYCFVGFLPDKSKDKRAVLSQFSTVAATLIFYVPPHSLNDDLAAMYAVLGARKAALVRELTKIHEEAVPITLFQSPDFAARGEYVVVVEGAPPPVDGDAELAPEEHLKKLRAEGVDEKTAVKTVASARGLAKNEIYQLNLALKARDKEDE